MPHRIEVRKGRTKMVLMESWDQARIQKVAAHFLGSPGRAVKVTSSTKNRAEILELELLSE